MSRVTTIDQTVLDCTISNGGSLSAGVGLDRHRLVGISLPAGFEGTTLSFQSSYDGTVWNNVYDATGTEKTVTVAASRRVILSPADFYGIAWIKVRNGPAGAPSNVGADRILKLVCEQ